ncbi:YihY/virulence factor BrkB family protein [Cupriavidus oxalaticus]|uniref:Ribonuclease BN n=1 Tax=Cupriavidus oxalaticus TaxID=96344 RepID=A0A375GMM1_9BURK|nr:YihY/virulence factor BrkB family protein [Cupriavidus oxalaticus]QRQ85207.1 YihY/virulence factor BrkB family protein [Cupriavidus oxalaticus]QRQ90705.1 YihY/virulence factor BrkB family protein [Cupriavidus oxalaticus]WQD85231.1 YihY/virulence factor BrkB family protein [Cupriavidus oxalaticus]SPC07359.1 Ribonuclease BN [Cupriavidus oxalaticus]SPC23463.1 Ribonuclease BN [Cupriavidus oxalaticus]
MLSLGPVSPRAAFELIRESIDSWIDDYAPSMGAALAYYTVFSIAPLLMIVITVAGVIFGAEAARGEVVSELNGLIGAEGAQVVEDMLVAVSEPAASTVTAILGVVALVVGATTVFAELQSALDRIWRVPQRQKSSGLFALLRARLLSFGMILGIGFLLVVSLLLSAGISAMGREWGPLLGIDEAVGHVLDTVISLVLTTVVFAMIYKIMPRTKIRWFDVWLGAIVTALLFTLGKFLIGLYIGKSGVASGYGAAGSLVVLLLWVYYAAQIFLLGAEFTWHFAQRFGSLRHSGQPAPPTAPTAPIGGRAPVMVDEHARGDATRHPVKTGNDGVTPIVALYVDEIVNAAVKAGEQGQATAVDIADAAEKAFTHFRTVAGPDKQALRNRLRELAQALVVAAEAGHHSGDTRDLIQFGVSYVEAYLHRTH